MICQKRSNKMKDGTKKEYRYYVCSTYHKQGRNICSQANVPASKLESVIFEYIKDKVYSIWENFDKESVQEKRNNNDDLKQELKLVEGLLSKKINAVKSLMETRDLYDHETFMSLNKEMNTEIKNIREQKEKVEANLESKMEGNRIFDIKHFIDKFDGIDISDNTELRDFFSKVLIEVQIDNKSVKSIKTIRLS